MTNCKLLILRFIITITYVLYNLDLSTLTRKKIQVHRIGAVLLWPVHRIEVTTPGLVQHHSCDQSTRMGCTPVIIDPSLHIFLLHTHKWHRKSLLSVFFGVLFSGCELSPWECNSNYSKLLTLTLIRNSHALCLLKEAAK